MRSAELTPEFVLAAIDGTLAHAGGVTGAFTGVSIDGRNVPPGGLWFAIRGERFDGHQFANQAIECGPAGFVVERGRATEILALPGAENLAIIEVDDSIRALGALGRAWRLAMPALRVAGVAGSNGKTTTKEMLAAILEAHAGEAAVLKTEGNFNNHIGLPLTLLRLNSSHRFAVLEMGMSALGELAYLATLGRPDVAVVVNIGAEHLLTLNDIETVARAEGEIFASLPPDGVAVWPDDEQRIAPYAEASRAARRICFGRTAGVGVRVLSAVVKTDGTDIVLRLPDGALVESHLGIVGLHNAGNAAAAAAVAHALGASPASIAAGLPMARAAKHRSSLGEIGGRHIIDDCYNASPPSMAAALDTVVDFARQVREKGGKSRAIAVLTPSSSISASSGQVRSPCTARSALAPPSSASTCSSASALSPHTSPRARAQADLPTIESSTSTRSTTPHGTPPVRAGPATGSSSRPRAAPASSASWISCGPASIRPRLPLRRSAARR